MFVTAPAMILLAESKFGTASIDSKIEVISRSRHQQYSTYAEIARRDDCKLINIDQNKVHENTREAFAPNSCGPIYARYNIA